jgi:hypothetical protein
MSFSLSPEAHSFGSSFAKLWLLLHTVPIPSLRPVTHELRIIHISSSVMNQSFHSTCSIISHPSSAIARCSDLDLVLNAKMEGLSILSETGSDWKMILSAADGHQGF